MAMMANKSLENAKRDALKLDASFLDIGEQNNTIPCPECGVPKSFGVTRVPEGLVYNCLRVTCGARGFIPMVGGFQYSAEKALKRKEKPKTNPYMGAMADLPKAVVTWIGDRYELSPTVIEAQGWKYDNTGHRIIMPLNSYFGYEFGHCGKKLPNSVYTGAKAFNYFSREEPTKLAFPKVDKLWKGRNKAIVLVEDVISATKVARYMHCAALLGTNLTHKQIAFLSAHFTEIYMMLDPDAIGKSLLYNRQYGSLFDQFRIINLPADPKDYPHRLIESALMSSC